MKLLKLNLKNYRQFIDYTIEFADGLHLIWGNNEAGKSTLTNALLDALYLSPDKRNTQVTSLSSWQSNQLPIITLEFSYVGKKYELVKDFPAKKSSLTMYGETGGQKQITGIAEVNEALNKVLVFDSREMYLSTAFLSADSIAEIHDDKSGLKNALQNAAVGGAGIDVHSILEKLEKEQANFERGLKRYSNNPGPVKEAQEKMSEYDALIKAEKVALMSKSNGLEESDKVANELKILSEKLQVATTLLKENDKIKESKKKADDAQQKYAETQSDLDVILDFERRVQGYHQELAKLPDYDWQQLKNDLNEYEINVQTLKMLDTNEEPAKTNQKQRIINLLIPGVIALIGIVIAVVLQNYWLIALGALFALVVAFILNSKAKTQPQLQQNSNVKLIAELNAKVLDFETTYAGMSKLKLKNILEDYEKFKSELNDAEKQLSGLLQLQSKEALIVIQKDALRDLRIEQQVLDELKAEQKLLSQLEYQKLQNQVSEMTSKVRRLEESQIELRTTVKTATASDEQLAFYEEQYEMARKKYEKAQLDLSVNLLMQQGLRAAIANTSKTASSLIEVEVEKYLPILTNNRYKKCQLDDELQIKVYSDAKQDWCICDTTTTELSRGTVDQIYLITRLALVQILSAGKSLPIIMDDPLLTFDKSRKLKALNLLQDLAKTYQIIFFTFDQELPCQTKLS